MSSLSSRNLNPQSRRWSWNKFSLEAKFIFISTLAAVVLLSLSNNKLDYATTQNDQEGQLSHSQRIKKHSFTRAARIQLLNNRTQIDDNDLLDPDKDPDPETIPPYFTPITEQHLHNGRVVQELSRRVLSRSIAQANVVIVSPYFNGEDAPKGRVADAHVITITGNEANDNEMVVGQNLLEQLYTAKLAIDQGHTTHLLPATTNLSLGWNSAVKDDKETMTPTSIQHYNSTSVSWILLAYFSTVRVHHASEQSISIDEILSPAQSSAWLKETTITYLVFPISATAELPYSTILEAYSTPYEYSSDYIRDAKISVTGMTAAQTLLDHNYKLQLLASSHHFDAEPNRIDHDGKDEEVEASFVYGPNTLFMSSKALYRYLYQRVMQVLEKEAKNILERYPREMKNHQHVDNFHSKNNKAIKPVLKVHFHSLLFATQGLDLAIPSRMSYTDIRRHRSCDNIGGSRHRKTRCDPKLTSRALNDTIFQSCPSRHSDPQIKFGIQQFGFGYITEFEKKNRISLNLSGNQLEVPPGGEVEVWTSLPENPASSEAACVKINKNAILPSVACTTRILPSLQVQQQLGIAAQKRRQPQNNKDVQPNLLFIMIDPLSRMQLKRSLPNTMAALDLMGFVDFDHYMAVGNNSGPNQAALYSGIKLEGGRQGIKNSGTDKQQGEKRVWLWDRLKDAGYITMKVEDACISNSNMVQSMNPQVHHGEQLNEMFCYSYDRPNCLGEKLMAEHAVNYTLQFIHTYDREQKDSRPSFKRPWAAFLSFVDSHEDSLTLISYLDSILLDFLQTIPLKETFVVFTSDHGLHYGSQLATKPGEMERAMPQLFLRLPTFQKQTQRFLQRNAHKYTTAFDTHKTILDILLNEDHSELKGMSLLKPLPQSRSQCRTTEEIPSQYCPPGNPFADKDKQCQFMVDPPSIFSFYADIPRLNRPHWPDGCPMKRNHNEFGNNVDCQCATNTRNWFECSNITREDFRGSIDLQNEHFSLRSCGKHELDKTIELDMHVKKNQAIVNQRAALTKDHATNTLAGFYGEEAIQASIDARPNILLLEIDSVSLSASERFFPKTWRLLQQHKIQIDGNGSSSCPTDWCAGTFNRTSVVGQNSIVNQLAALSGCLESNDPEEKLTQYSREKEGKGPRSFCPTGGTHSLGTDKNSEVKRDHWIFDVAKNLGYVTFFGEEFCYDDSPWVVQSQSAFKLDVDLALDRLFCHFATDWMKTNGKINSKLQTYGVEYDTKEVPDYCFDGKSRGEIGLEFIEQMWDAYDDTPKFAFLNALAAHDYSLDAAHAPLSAERYDTTVFKFLSKFLKRDDERDTYIIIRSDHGLQGGPYPIDYSTQIEHMNPFTAIIAPANHPGLSVEHFAANQNRLATGFDLYHSMRYLMSPSLFGSGEEESKLIFDAGIPPWSYNLLRQTIPRNRNCKEAKIPDRFCPCVNERGDIAPGFYVGHSEQMKTAKFGLPELWYDWNKKRFVARRLPGYKLLKRSPKYEVARNGNVTMPTCNTSLGQYIDETMLEESWQLINNLTNRYPGSDVSGGIFLYPRQTMLLTYLVQREVASRPSLEPFRICETGFGSGHSSALFLSAAPNVEVWTFDRFDRPYQTATFTALRSLHGQRISRVVGDSCAAVKRYAKECHFLHGSSLCKNDNINLIEKANAGTILTSTAMDSLTDKSVYFGEGAQWATLQKNGCIENIVCFEEEEMMLNAEFVFSRGKNQTISHKFCIAVSTGTCGLGKKETNFLPPWHKHDFCQRWMLEVPNGGEV